MGGENLQGGLKYGEHEALCVKDVGKGIACFFFRCNAGRHILIPYTCKCDALARCVMKVSFFTSLNILVQRILA